MKLAEQSATDTLPKLLRRNMQTFGGQVGMREKDRGIWQSYSWNQCYEHVREFALGLAAAGLKRGDKLSVLGDNRPRLYWAQLAAQALGGTAVPLYQDSIASELAFVLQHAEVTIIVAEDQEQIDKVLSIARDLPSLRLLIYEDPRGMSGYDHPLLKSFTDLEIMGRAFEANQPGYVERELELGSGSDVALIAYTSGTTGRSKGALLSHANMIATSESFASVESIGRGDNWLCYLPMGWVGDSMFSLSTSLVVAATCNCPESPETVQRDLRELGPTAVLAPPRIWENMLTSVQVRAADATPLKRGVFAHFRRVAEEAEILRSDGKPVPLWLRLQLAVGEFLVYGPIRDQLGLRRARWAYTGGAPLGPDTFRFFRSIGVNLKQVYGSTESSALISIQPDAEANPTSAGRPCPGIEVKIADRGEVLIRSRGIFKGYYKAEAATREVVDGEGWFHTGDAGFLDPRGHLVIIDRAKDVGAMVDGTPFAPQFIENKLKFSPYIREAVAFGNEKPFVAAMIAIDLNTVGNWAERRGIPYTSYMDLTQKPEIRELVREEIAKGNATLPDSTKIRRFLLLTKDLEADDAEMTRTRKVRRRFEAEKYAGINDAFYSGGEEVELSTLITYEDGRQANIQSRVRIADVDAGALSHA